MILADTSVWIDHFRRRDQGFEALLAAGQILGHPFVTGEIALGSLRQRTMNLSSLNRLPQSVPALARSSHKYEH